MHYIEDNGEGSKWNALERGERRPGGMSHATGFLNVAKIVGYPLVGDIIILRSWRRMTGEGMIEGC